MRLTKYSITLTKYVWSTGIELSEVNIFNKENAINKLSFDLKPYIIDMSEISWDLDATDEEDGKSNLFFEESDVSYTLNGSYNNNYLVEQFGIFRDTNYEKYQIEIINIETGKTVHKGIISQELIEYDKNTSKSDNKIISVTALGFMKEFKAYFETKEMLHNDTELTWHQYQLPNVIRRDHYDRWRCSMRDLLTQTFAGAGINFILDQDVNEWYIIKNPILGKRQNYIGHTADNTCWIKSSYERIRANGENRFDLIRRICNNMGWVFYYSDNNFYIKNRVPVETSEILDYKNITGDGITFSKQKESTDYENIVILNGLMSVGLPIHEQGWGHMDGTRMRIFTPNPTSTKERWWNNIPDDWNLLGSGVNPDINFKVQKNYNEDSNYFRYCLVGNSIGGWYIAYIYALKQKSILFIDAGETGNSAWGYDTTTGETFPREFTYDPGEEEIQFTGNYGSAMFKLKGQFPNQHPYTFEDYKESTIFNNNFQKYFRSNLDRRITVNYKGIISNPLQKYTFINAPSELNGEWTTVSLKADLMRDESVLELRLKEN